MAFDHIVSLGAWCQTAYQIKQQNQSILTTCFDWLVTPWDAIFAILKSDGQSFGLQATFDVYSKCVKCDHYGVLYAHEFATEHVNTKNLNFEQGQAFVTEERLKQCRSKLLHKYGSMISTLQNGGATLFVRFGATAEPAAAWPYLADPNPRNEEDLNRLVHLLREKFPQNNAKLLYLWQEPVAHHVLDLAKIDRHVMVMPIPLPSAGTATWMGEDKIWFDVFETVNRSMKLQGTKVDPLHPASTMAQEPPVNFIWF